MLSLLAAVNLLAWSTLTYIGIDLVHATMARAVPGYPTIAGILYRVGIPALFLVISAAQLALGWKRPGLKQPFAVELLIFLGLLPFLATYGGGV